MGDAGDGHHRLQADGEHAHELRIGLPAGDGRLQLDGEGEGTRRRAAGRPPVLRSRQLHRLVRSGVAQLQVSRRLRGRQDLVSVSLLDR